MNYKKRFNKIVEQIGDHEKIKGIDRIYDGGNGYLSITVKGIDITRGCGGGLYKIEFSSSADMGWESCENINEKLEEWFSYVESKVRESIPSEVIVNGRKYKLVE